MTSFVFDNFQHDAFLGNVSAADTFYVMLVGAGYAADQGAHAKRSDVTAEVAGAGYSAGGLAVVPTFTKNTAAHREQIVFPGVAWPNSTISARRAVYYKRRGGAAAADELVATVDFGADISSAGTTFSLAATTINLNNPAG